MGYHFFLSFCLSHSTKKIHRGDPCDSEVVWYGRKFCTSGMVSRLSVEIFVSHSAGKNQWGAPLCIEKIFSMKFFMHRRGGGVITVFSISFFHKTEKILEGDPCVSEMS